MARRYGYLLKNAEVWVSEYVDMLDIKYVPCIRWDRRLRVQIANAEIWEDRAKIRLSPESYPLVPPKRRIEVIAHEMCHLAAWERFGTKIEHHGPEWSELMESLGFEPHATFPIERSR